MINFFTHFLTYQIDKFNIGVKFTKFKPNKKIDMILLSYRRWGVEFCRLRAILLFDEILSLISI